MEHEPGTHHGTSAGSTGDAGARLVERFRRALRERPEEARRTGAIFLVELRGDPGEHWTLDLESDPARVSPGEPECYDCSLAATPEDFVSLLDQPDMVLQLVFEGRITIAGNTALAARFRQLMRLTP